MVTKGTTHRANEGKTESEDMQHEGFMKFAEELGKFVGAELYRRSQEAKQPCGAVEPADCPATDSPSRP